MVRDEKKAAGLIEYSLFPSLSTLSSSATDWVAMNIHDDGSPAILSPIRDHDFGMTAADKLCVLRTFALFYVSFPHIVSLRPHPVVDPCEYINPLLSSYSISPYLFLRIRFRLSLSKSVFVCPVSAFEARGFRVPHGQSLLSNLFKKEKELFPSSPASSLRWVWQFGVSLHAVKEDKMREEEKIPLCAMQLLKISPIAYIPWIASRSRISFYFSFSFSPDSNLSESQDSDCSLMSKYISVYVVCGE